MTEHSYVEIDSAVAIELATARKRSIDVSREREVQRIIDREIQRINSGFFHKLFRRKDVTREEVEAMELNYEWSDIADTRYLLYGRVYETCNDVLLAAKSGGKLTLSLDDYRSIN